MNSIKRSGLLLAAMLIVVLGMTSMVMAREGENVAESQTPASAALAIALTHLEQNKTSLGLTDADLNNYVVQWQYTSQHNGVTHIILRQTHAGIEVWQGDIRINVARDGSIINVHNQFVSDLAGKVNGTTPALTAVAAVEAAAQHLGLTLSEPLEVQESLGGADRAAVLSSGGISLQPIPVKLMYQANEKGQVRLVWDMEIEELSGLNWWTMRVDAATGEILSQLNRVADDSYRVYAPPVESPYFSVPPAPADGRTLEVNPATANASPFGWHDTNGAAGAEFTTTQGNNVHGYTDVNADNVPDAGSSPDGGATLVFDFPLDLTQQPSAYRPAAVSNLFYWNNLIHDVFYEYGFDEAAANFQENNYGNGGVASDYVQAEAQDGSGTCNANFGTPGDGGNPRMQMYICENGGGAPAHDGDLDNLVIVHEYGHGISNRLNDPANASCLGNAEQMGEGWSDYWGTWMTIEPGDTGADPRGVGTYLFEEGAGGPGIRPAPYSTDFGINNFTYGDLPSQAVPHGVGFVWATMIWDLNWALIDEYGFNSDIYAAWNTGGNNLANQLVIDGLTLQPCNPGFVDGRNAILAADQALTGGANQCTIWQAFATRGLGFSASQGSSNSSGDGTEAFDMPAACLTLDVTPTSNDICQGDTAVYTVGIGTAFTPPVTMSATGNPAPSTATFSVNPVPTVPSTTDLTIGNTGTVAAGGYTINIAATDGTVSDNADVTLNVFAGAPGAAPVLTSPPNGSSGVATSPTLSWNAVASASSYHVEIATDAAFTNIVYTADEATTTHLVGVALDPDTLHYWRVRADNPCGNGATSTAFTFTTVNIICSSPALAIPDNTTVFDDLTIGTNGTLLDLNLSIDASHTWVGDTTFTLTHQDTGTSVTMIDRPGYTGTGFGCSGDNIDAELDDEGADGPVENQCSNAPALFGSPTPNNPLSVLDGEDLSGTWRLSVTDSAGGDTGTLNEWCIIPATEAVGYSIELDKTVGTDPTTCAVTDSILLPPGGGDVTYCYTVTNTGVNTLTIHTLVDDQLGTILNNFPYTLAPGASAFVTATTTVAATVVNVADWTASDGSTSVSATDMATVTVQTYLPDINVDPTSLTSVQATDTTITETFSIQNVGEATPLVGGSGDLIWTILEDGGTIFGSHNNAAPIFALPAVAANSSATAAETVNNAVPATSSGDAPAAAATWAPSGGILYDNGPLVNSPGTGPGGSDESLLQDTSLGMTIYGFGHQTTASNSVADDFTIPAGDTWTIDSLTFFAYQTGSTTTSTITGVNAIIYDGDPSSGGSVVDSSSNMVSSDWSGIYRGLESAPGNTQRPVMASVVDFGGLVLSEGTYWVEWQTAGSLASGPWAPPITINGQSSTGNGLQNLAGTWGPATDVGQQGFPFLITGSSGPQGCSTDIPWASVTPTNGTTAVLDSSEVSVAFDSTGLATGVYTGTLCIDSNDADEPRVTLPLTLEVVTPSYALELSGDDAATSLAGTTVTYTMQVTNTSNVADVIDLTVSGNVWVTTLSDSSLSLDAGETATFWVWVEVPGGAADGDMDNVTVMAMSQGDNSQMDTAVLTTTAEVPPPPSYMIYLPIIMKP